MTPLPTMQNCQISANEKGHSDRIVVGALGTITKFEKYIESLGIEMRTEHIQKSALLKTAK